MLPRNILGFLNKHFLIVAGCIICYSSCISGFASKLHFLGQSGLIVNHLITAAGEQTAQSNKTLNNFFQAGTYDCGSKGKLSWVMMPLLPPAPAPFTVAAATFVPGATHMEKVPPGGLASTPSCCECLEVEKHSASHRYRTNDSYI